MHLIRSTSFKAAKIVNAAEYAGLKAEDFQSVKVLRTAKDILWAKRKNWKHQKKISTRTFGNFREGGDYILHNPLTSLCLTIKQNNFNILNSTETAGTKYFKDERSWPIGFLIQQDFI